MKKTSAIDGAYRYFIESLICPEDPCLYLSPVPKGKKHGGELVPSNADFSSSVSVKIARQWARRLASELTVSSGKRGGQQVGRALLLPPNRLPGRIGSVALGTGDIDCVYHIALDALLEAVESVDAGDAYDHLRMMVDGRRLKDIRDLPYDLIV